MSPPLFKVLALTFLLLLACAAPLSTNAANPFAQFQNPVPNLTPVSFLKNIINFILTLAGFLALLGIVYGGVMIIIGGMSSEQGINKGKQIILWSLIGLAVTSAAALILQTLNTLLTTIS